MGYSLWGRKEMDTTERLTLQLLLLNQADCLPPLCSVLFLRFLSCYFIWNIFLWLLISPNSLCCLFLLGKLVTVPSLAEVALCRRCPMRQQHTPELYALRVPTMWAAWTLLLW